jgi:mannan endo-1,4-beta-mannosidase
VRARTAVAALAVVTLAGCSAAPPAAAGHTAAPRPARHQYLGVSSPAGMAGAARFAAATGARPDLVSTYAGWYEPFDQKQAQAATAYGALPLVFLDSGKVPVSQIADGPDTWLKGYAKQVAAWGKPVAFSFDSDFNGPWWPWSFNHESAAAFTAAWRRVVTVFRQAGAGNVTWVWTVAASSPATTALGPWWPGASYVNWVGLNAYYTQAGSTFSTVFSPTMKQLAKLTGDPVLITETGALPAAGRPRAIADLFRGVEADPSVLGFIWFDYDKPSAHGPDHNWLIDNDPAALAAFRAAVKEYG